MWPRDEALQFFAAKGEPLKVQLIEEKTEGQSEVSVYTIKDRETFVDFCVGPHVPSTGRLKAFKLLTTSNAYWKGDARNQPMQRISGTAFLSEAELKAHLQRVEEAKKRDHRKVGKDLGLFMVNDAVGAGRAVLAAKRARRSVDLLADYIVAKVLSPGRLRSRSTRRSIFNKAICDKRSGHWQHYRENMFLVDGARDGADRASRPMNCPRHILIFAIDSAELPRSAGAAGTS